MSGSQPRCPSRPQAFTLFRVCFSIVGMFTHDLSLSTHTFVTTEPGGKTVVLKTLGLVALMARAGIPIPADPGARVDLFDPVLADIGDLQSVTGDLSTFSGHLVVSRSVWLDARGAMSAMWCCQCLFFSTSHSVHPRYQPKGREILEL